VLEQPAPAPLDRRAQHLVMCGEGLPHQIRVRLPPTGRTLNIGEQKRHHPRRSSSRRSGHPCRISQQTRSYLPHRRNPAQTPAPRRLWLGRVFTVDPPPGPMAHPHSNGIRDQLGYRRRFVACVTSRPSTPNCDWCQLCGWGAGWADAVDRRGGCATG
jgi:hypothetical protein